MSFIHRSISVSNLGNRHTPITQTTAVAAYRSMFYDKGFNISRLTIFRSHPAVTRTPGLEHDGQGSHVMHVVGIRAATPARRGSIYITLDIVRGRGPQVYPKSGFDRMI